MSYNLTQVTVNGTGLLEFTQGVNTELMFGLLGTLLLLMIGSVFLIVFYKSTEDIKKSISATTIILFVLSLLLRIVGLVPDMVVYTTLISAAVSFVFVLWD